MNYQGVLWKCLGIQFGYNLTLKMVYHGLPRFIKIYQESKLENVLQGLYGLEAVRISSMTQAVNLPIRINTKPLWTWGKRKNAALKPDVRHDDVQTSRACVVFKWCSFWNWLVDFVQALFVWWLAHFLIFLVMVKLPSIFATEGPSIMNRMPMDTL